MYVALLYLWGSDDHYGYEKWESKFEVLFTYFVLTFEQQIWLLQARVRCRYCSCSKRSAFQTPFSAWFEPSSSRWDSWVTSDLYALNFLHEFFYFCGKHIYTEGDEKEVERNMYAVLSYFRDSDDHYGYEKWESNLEGFFRYFVLTSEQKYCYAQMRLVGKASWWWKNIHSSCLCLFVLQDLFRTRYAPYLLFTEFRETLEGIWKIIGDMAVKVDIKLELVVDEPEPEVVDEPELRVKSCCWVTVTLQ